MQSLLPGSQLSEVAEFKLAAGKLGEKGPRSPVPPSQEPQEPGQWRDTGEGLRVAPHSTQQRNPSDWRLGAGGPLPPGWQPGSSRGSQVSVDLRVVGGLPQHPGPDLLLLLPKGGSLAPAGA